MLETEDNLDIKNARKVLDEDHHGLIKVKDRVLEYLAIRHLAKNMKGPILCLVGPPGVGNLYCQVYCQGNGKKVRKNVFRWSKG